MSGFPQKDFGDGTRSSHKLERSSGLPSDPGLLERVLGATEALLCADTPLDDAQRAALRDVARRYRGQPLAVSPVAVELVQAVVGRRFRQCADSEPLWREMAMTIAETIVEDPLARGRLESLWTFLGESQ
jgi:hypothetical protein